MRENLWAIIGAISGVLAVGISVFVFLVGRSEQTKKLEIQLIARSILVDETISQAKQRIEVRYDGRKIPNYVILQLRVANTGGQIIRHTDYEEYFGLHFDNVTEILSADQVSSDPKQLKVKADLCSPDCQSIRLPLALLNPKDWYILEVGIAAKSGKKPIIDPRGRIAGVKQIELRESLPPPKNEISKSWVIWVLSIVALILALLSILFVFLERMLPFLL